MNRKELIDAMASRTGSSKAEADRSLGALLNIISDTLKIGKILSLVWVLARESAGIQGRLCA